MEYESILANIRMALDKKYPSGASKNNVLRKVLKLDKMGAYRRLNGMVQFKVGELATLCSALHLPADALLNLQRGKTLSLNLQLPDYATYDMDDHELHRKSLDILDSAVRSGNSKHVVGCNSLPHTHITDYDNLLRFCLCKWLYFRNDSGVHIPFSKVWLAEDLVKIKKEIARKLAQFSSTVVVWDSKIIESTLTDIRYFYKINLITESEIDDIRAELRRYVDDMERLAARGHYTLTGNPIYTYISSVSIDSNYGFIDSDNVKASILQAFILNIGWNTDPDSFEYVKSWINTLIRSSTLISTSGELARVEFFDRQRKAIDNFI